MDQQTLWQLVAQFLIDNYLPLAITMLVGALFRGVVLGYKALTAHLSESQHKMLDRILEEGVVAAEKFAHQPGVYNYYNLRKEVAKKYVLAQAEKYHLKLDPNTIELQIEQAVAENEYILREIKEKAEKKRAAQQAAYEEDTSTSPPPIRTWEGEGSGMLIPAVFPNE